MILSLILVSLIALVIFVILAIILDREAIRRFERDKKRILDEIERMEKSS